MWLTDMQSSSTNPWGNALEQLLQICPLRDGGYADRSVLQRLGWPSARAVRPESFSQLKYDAHHNQEASS